MARARETFVCALIFFMFWRVPVLLDANQEKHIYCGTGSLSLYFRSLLVSSCRDEETMLFSFSISMCGWRRNSRHLFLHQFLTQVIFFFKGWKFLKKLWCCVGGGNKVIWLYQLSWKCKLATVTSYKAIFFCLISVLLYLITSVCCDG